MPNKSYSFPHVAISKYAVPRVILETGESNAPVMFAPFKSAKGPANVLKKIYTLGEFANVYGTISFDLYSDSQHELLNISNWLSNGGAVLAYRLEQTVAVTEGTDTLPANNIDSRASLIRSISYGTDSAVKACEFSAKFTGSFYNGIMFLITKPTDTSLTFRIVSSDKKTELEKFTVASNTYQSIISASEYVSFDEDGLKFIEYLLGLKKTEFEAIEIIKSSETAGTDKTTIKVTDAITGGNIKYLFGDRTLALTLDGLGKTAEGNRDFCLKKLLTDGNKDLKLILNSLETPIDVFMDGDYSNALKSLILQNLATYRTDIHFFMNMFDPAIVDSTNLDPVKVEDITSVIKDPNGDKADLTNVSFFAQYCVANNSYTGSDIKVGPTYFLSSLVPFNELKYGIQYPTAGATRGSLIGIKGINSNPDPADKETLYEGRVNYIEKDSRGYKFMCQLTRGLENTALSWTNNSRTTSRIARDIELIGREYLFEFNDSTTLGSMRTRMNKYLNDWVQNRTLSLAEIEINKTSDTSIEISLQIKFTGTIEIIAVAITIE